MQRIAAFLVLVVVAGCSGQTRSYSVRVQNNLPRPITIALTKNGPRFESAWASPEDVAARRVSPDNTAGIKVVEAKQTVSVPNISGHFDKGTQAVLRIYSGAMSYREMLDTPTGPQRVDATLSTGQNTFVVDETAQGLSLKTGP